MPTPIVTVVVPIRNEAKAIESTIRSLMNQDFPPEQFEILIADGASTDDTVPIVRRLQAEYSNLQLFYNPNRFSSAARNTIIRHMRGQYAVIIDGHCHIPDQNYLRNLVEAFETTGADTLGRPQPLNATTPTSFQQAVSIARQSRLGHNPESDIFSEEAKFVPPQSTAVAYRRDVFHKIGMFDQSFDACEDVEFNQRVNDADLTCYFTPKLKVMYFPRNNWKALFYQLGRYGGGRARLAAKQLNTITLPALVPPLWVLWVALVPLFAWLLPSLWILYGFSLALYVTVIVLSSMWLARNQSWGVQLRTPLVFVGIHFGFAWGFWKEIRNQFRKRVLAS